MVVNCFYDECEKFADIIYIPDIIEDIEGVQDSFFSWLFDKQIDHKYWVIVNSEKKYCQYGTQAFVNWLNQYVIDDSSEKAYFISENDSCWDRRNKRLVF